MTQTPRTRPPQLPRFDAQSIPVTSYGTEPPIDPAHLSGAALRHSFLDPRPWQPEVSDEQTQRGGEINDLTPAAVLVPVVMRDNGLTVMLTQRTAHLNDHAGQVAFPGGRVEPHDATLVETALRETEEETGLARRHIETLGHLPDYLTGSGFRVTPVVALVAPPFALAPDRYEVAEVFEVPLAFFMNPANHQVRIAELDTGRRIFHAMPYGRHFVWGATAGMLRNLYWFLSSQLPRR